MKNAMTFDVEDWFQLAYRAITGRSVSPSTEVVRSVERIAVILAQKRTRATFFVHAQVAEAYPEMVKELQREGHEVASHGYAHRRVVEQTLEEFQRDLVKSVEVLEAVTGQKVVGYRAPCWLRTWSPNVLKIMAQLGLRYDSSMMPGTNGAADPRHPLGDAAFTEFPPFAAHFLGRDVPVTRTRYLRLLPYSVIERAVKKANSEGDMAVIAIHSWEADRAPLPSMSGLGLKSRLRMRALDLTYRLNRASVEKKLASLLDSFDFVPLRDLLAEPGQSEQTAKPPRQAVEAPVP